MKLIWLTDPHLEFLSEKATRGHSCRCSPGKPDAVLITGDSGYEVTLTKQ